jgi:hypothetical protein
MWGKLNPNERLSAYGGVILVVIALIGYVLSWSDGPTLGLLVGIAVLAILYLKYAPNMNITWPMPVATILLGVGGITAILLALNLLRYLRFLVGVDALVLLGLPLGAALVAWGAWKEYQATAKPAA